MVSHPVNSPSSTSAVVFRLSAHVLEIVFTHSNILTHLSKHLHVHFFDIFRPSHVLSKTSVFLILLRVPDLFQLPRACSAHLLEPLRLSAAVREQCLAQAHNHPTVAMGA